MLVGDKKRLCLPLLAGFSLIVVLVSSAHAETWDAWLARCRSWQDVESWMDAKFSYDQGRLADVANWARGMKLQAPQTTFEKASGVCADAALLCKHALNRINSNYRAEVVHLNPGQGKLPHYVCAFFLDKRLHIMDYGTYVEATRGMFGPFDSLEEYVDLYCKRSGLDSLEGYGFGWMKVRPANR